MTRLLLLALTGVALCAAQILPPLIGHMRDRRGGIVPVYGVAGTFTLGPPIADGIDEASFGPDGAFFRTAEGWFAFGSGARIVKLEVETVELLLTRKGTWMRDPTGEQCRRLRGTAASSAQPCPADFLTVEDFTSRIELPEEITAFERMGDDWFVLRGARGLYAVRWTAGGEPQMWQLPEAEAEPDQGDR
jgi:hypothetical protein